MHIIGEVESSAWSTVTTVLGWPTQCRILNKKSSAQSLVLQKLVLYLRKAVWTITMLFALVGRSTDLPTILDEPIDIVGEGIASWKVGGVGLH